MTGVPDEAAAAAPRSVGRRTPSRVSSANYHANALVRGLELIELLAESGRPLNLNDFSGSTGMPKSTLVRLLAVLCDLGYTVRVDDRPTFRLGYKVQAPARAYVASLDLSAAATRYLAPLAERSGHTANLGLLDGDRVVHVCVAEPDRPLRFATALGARDHLHCTGLGKMLLSELPERELAERLPAEPFPRFTDNTRTDLAELLAECRRVHRRGFAFDDNERSVGLRCLAVPVRHDGECVAALSVAGASAEFTTRRNEDYVRMLADAAELLAADDDVIAAVEVARSRA